MLDRRDQDGAAHAQQGQMVGLGTATGEDHSVRGYFQALGHRRRTRSTMARARARPHVPRTGCPASAIASAMAAMTSARTGLVAAWSR